MTGILAQIIALTAHGNNYLKNGIIPAAFDATNTTFESCNTVDFREFKKQFFFSIPTEKIVAGRPTEWFKYLKAGGCKHMRLYFEHSQDQSFGKDYKLAGLVGGGGNWLIETIYDGYSNYWANRWEVTDQNAADRNIWSVNYGMTIKNQNRTDRQIDNQEAKAKLYNTLTEIADFAYKHNLQSWGEQFDKAQAALDSASPEYNYYHKDLVPLDNYALTAKQILFAAGTAWVFGGMGSWNDLGFDNKADDEVYERLSEQLYSNINEAIISAINTF